MKTDYSHIPAVFAKEAFYSVQEFVTIKGKTSLKRMATKQEFYCIVFYTNERMTVAKEMKRNLQLYNSRYFKLWL